MVIILNDKAIKDIINTCNCMFHNIDEININVNPETYQIDADCIIRPSTFIKCIEINMPYYNCRCLQGLRTRHRYNNFNNKWRRWYDFNNKSKYIMKRR